MKILKAKDGTEIIVDDQDYNLFKFMPWNINANGYARTYVSIRCKNGKYSSYCVVLHKLLFKSDNKMVVDHINHNKLDNRRSNLRLVSRAINALNTKANLNDGVGVKKRFKKWNVHLTINDRFTHLGSFNSQEEAIAYRKQYINNLHKIELFKLDQDLKT